MILVDGRDYGKDVQNFGTLEELLIDVKNGAEMQGRIVTDVLVNNEIFSEIYPHQADDITTNLFSSVEIRSVPNSKLALDIVGEMDKVCKMMKAGSRTISSLLRRSANAEALELFQDLLDVTRDFLAMQNGLRLEFGIEVSGEYGMQVKVLDALLAEMNSVMEQEDWVLLADLLEYEFGPQCEGWEKVVSGLQDDIRNAVNQ